MCGLGIKIYAFELFLAGLAGLVVNSGLVCFREPLILGTAGVLVNR